MSDVLTEFDQPKIVFLDESPKIKKDIGDNKEYVPITVKLERACDNILSGFEIEVLEIREELLTTIEEGVEKLSELNVVSGLHGVESDQEKRFCLFLFTCLPVNGLIINKAEQDIFQDGEKEVFLQAIKMNQVRCKKLYENYIKPYILAFTLSKLISKKLHFRFGSGISHQAVFPYLTPMTMSFDCKYMFLETFKQCDIWKLAQYIRFNPALIPNLHPHDVAHWIGSKKYYFREVHPEFVSSKKFNYYPGYWFSEVSRDLAGHENLEAELEKQARLLSQQTTEGLGSRDRITPWHRISVLELVASIIEEKLFDRISPTNFTEFAARIDSVNPQLMNPVNNQYIFRSYIQFLLSKRIKKLVQSRCS